MKKQHLIFCLLALHAQIIRAQSFRRTDSGLQVKVNAVVTDIRPYSAAVVRILKYPAAQPPDKQSLSVIQTPQRTPFTTAQRGDVVLLKTGKLTVELNTRSGQVTFATPRGQQLLTESAAATFTPFDDAGQATYSVGQAFRLDTAEAIYGLGQQQGGKLSQRNVRLNMIQGNTDDYIPFFVSTKGYGLFWDNYSPTAFEDKPGSTSFTSTVGDCVDYYFMSGENIDGAIACMRELTGQAPLFPLWTYGFWQSKERYKSQQEITGVVQKYRELKVPLDGIIQDWQYWGNNYLWNAMDFLNPEFPDPKKMVSDIHRQNAHLIISIWNSFGPQTLQYRELAPKKMLLDFETWPQSGLEKWPPDMRFPSGVKPYDPYNPEARAIYWRYLNKGLFSLGLDGWWMDSSEPDHLSFKPSDLDNRTYLGSFRKVRNAFPLMTVGGVSQQQRQTSTDKRVFILTRSAFAGQQRYGANTWSGDVNSSWNSLRNQVPAGLNFSLSGIPYWNSDIGGFFAGAYNRRWNDAPGARNPLFQELYVRWLQFGALTPMMRSHGTDVPREIYQFGQAGEPVYDAIAHTIRLRYALLPYLYSTAWLVTHRQSTFMRALAMDFTDKKVVDLNSEYLFGPSILVAPVLHAQYTPETVVQTNAETGWNQQANAPASQKPVVDFRQPKTTEVYLPAGTDWINFWTNESFRGGQQVQQATTLHTIPLYLKAGSILPLGPDVQYATEKKWDTLSIRVYPGADGTFTLYEDENDNYNYEKGAYSTIDFYWNNRRRTLTIGRRAGSFPGMLLQRVFRITLAGAGKAAGLEPGTPDREVVYSGEQVEVRLK